MKAPNRLVIIGLLLILAGLTMCVALPKDSLLDTARKTLVTEPPIKKVGPYPGPQQSVDPYPGPPTLYPTWTPTVPVVYATSEPYYTPYWTPYPRPTLPWGDTPTSAPTETPEPKEEL
jgi:hypothetical protein